MSFSHENLLDRLLRYAPWAAAALVGLCIVALVVRVATNVGSGAYHDEMQATDATAPANQVPVQGQPASSAAAELRPTNGTQSAHSPVIAVPRAPAIRRELKESSTPSAKSRLVIHGARRGAVAEKSQNTFAGHTASTKISAASTGALSQPAAAAVRPVDVATRFGYKPATLDGRGYTSFFGIEASGKRFAYVLDRSGSMSEPENKPLAAAKAELLASVERLDALQQFFLIFYNEDVRQFSLSGRGRYFADDVNKGAARRFVESIQAQGGTRHYGALQRAINLRPDVIFLLTDGEPKDDLTADELKRLNRLNEGVAQIHVIQFAQSPYDGNSLEQLAKGNRGQHTYKSLQAIANSASAP